MVVPIMLASTTLRRMDGATGASTVVAVKRSPPDAARSAAGPWKGEMSANRRGLQAGRPGVPPLPREARGRGGRALLEVLRQFRARRRGQAGQVAVGLVAAA